VEKMSMLSLNVACAARERKEDPFRTRFFFIAVQSIDSALVIKVSSTEIDSSH
jgi:hypothetical protein